MAATFVLMKFDEGANMDLSMALYTGNLLSDRNSLHVPHSLPQIFRFLGDSMIP
jgi:hypothetical protein